MAIKRLVSEVINEQLGPGNEKLVEDHYRYYRQLCLAKHRNPLLAMQHGIALEGSEIVIGLGPSINDVSVRALQFAFEHALGHSMLAITALRNTEVLLAESEDFTARCIRLNDEWSELRRAGHERWGGEDPLKGKW